MTRYGYLKVRSPEYGVQELLVLLLAVVRWHVRIASHEP